MIETQEFDMDQREALIHAVSAECRSGRYHVIGIDGYPGTGKSNLAYTIASITRMNVINFDDFVKPKQDSYVSSLHVEIMRARIDVIKSQGLILEGLCMLEVIELMEIKISTLIYCKEISEGTRIWHDGQRYDPEYAELVSHQEIGLDAEVKKYHEKYRPWEKAKYIFNLFNQRKGIDR